MLFGLLYGAFQSQGGLAALSASHRETENHELLLIM
jgi:hypothetical protein